MPMPPRSKEGGEDLEEVERALSVLKGRHPEHERARREDEAVRAKRAAEQDARSRAEAKENLRKRALYGGAGGLVVLAMLGGGLAFRREVSRRGAIEQATDPYRAMGFVLVESSSRGEPSKVETKGEAGCWLAVPSQGAEAVALELTANETKVTGTGPLMACTCESGRIAVQGAVPEGGSLALLRIDAAAVGGSRAAAFLPFKPAAVGATDEPCAEATLDAWIDAKRAPKLAPDSAFLGAPERAPLVRAGFTSLVVVKEGVPFGVLDVPGQSCALVVPAKPGAQLALRGRGGAPVVASSAGPIALCTQNDLPVTLLRTAPAGEVHVLTAPAAKIGGLPGVREAARLAGIAIATESVAASDRAWSAKQVLLAANVPEQLVSIASAPDIAAEPEARIVALSFATPGALTAESPDGVFSYCEPPLDGKTLESLCTFSGPQTWHIGSKDATAGLARAKLPFWLFALQTVSDPVALKVETQMIGLARQLRLEGFEPTTLEALTETDKGADVLGRSNEDAVVAVALAPAPPFVFPLTDGPAWALGEAPRVVAVKPMEKVTLTSVVKGLPSATKGQRRTVVFRRQKAS